MPNRYLPIESGTRFEILKNGVLISCAFVITGCLLRVFEYQMVSAGFLIPDHALALYGKGMLYDLLFFAVWALGFTLFYICLTLLNKAAALRTTTALIWLFFIIHIALILYFAEVLTPLGADILAYSFIELNDTIRTSTDITFSKIFPFIFFPALFSVTYHFLSKIAWPRWHIAAGSVILMLLSAGYVLFYPTGDQFEKETDYTLMTSKSNYFLSEIANSLLYTPPRISWSGPEYPLLHETRYEDLLGPRFEIGKRPPNIVVIIVESLGGTVIPPHDDFGGFTPFLDSLASNSLYWTHFLSTSGRSFNAQPSIFASLPYGDKGFMELGYRAPDHHSLISILNNNGYHTAYFCGYESRFDKLDQFLERQKIDLLVDATRFTDEYHKMDEIEGGFTWGYSDKDTYRRAFDFIDPFDQKTPRLDIFFTLNFHEPFIIRESEQYRREFRERLHEQEPANRAGFEQYSDIFSALLYTDDAIRELLNRYREREDYESTIFIITGDHRMIPIPHRNRIDRYYVPFLIYSPMLKESAVIEGVSSHLDVTPSLLAFLQNNYQISVPDSIHWLGRELSMNSEFTSERIIPFMRNKNQMPDYLYGDLFLSGDQLFKLERGMRLRSVQNSDSLLATVSEAFDRFKMMNRYVTYRNKILDFSGERKRSGEGFIEEDMLFDRLGLQRFNAEELYFRARELALTNQYGNARIILRRLLREHPNYHDARLLLGRTFGWKGDYSRAESQFDEVLRRNPDLVEAYMAKADLYFWMGDPQRTLKIVTRGLVRDSSSVPLLFRKARAHRQNGDEHQAVDVLERALEIAPQDRELQTLKEELL